MLSWSLNLDFAGSGVVSDLYVSFPPFEFETSGTATFSSVTVFAWTDVPATSTIWTDQPGTSTTWTDA